jgi:hypothetical protein
LSENDRSKSDAFQAIEKIATVRVVSYQKAAMA